MWKPVQTFCITGGFFMLVEVGSRGSVIFMHKSTG
jgi:hypothetical protein